MTTSIQKLPPQNIEAEQAVLAGILLDNTAINRVLEVMQPADFYKETHRKIFSGMLDLSEANEGIDLISLPERLFKKGFLESIGGVSYLTDIMNSVATAANIHYHAKIVHEKALLRQLISTATDIVTQGFEDREGAGVADLLDYAEKSIFGISEARIRATFVPMKELIKKSFEVTEKISDHTITGLPTGFRDLDKLTSGMHPSDLIIVAGRPSMGKTSFALGIAQHVAIRHRSTVGIFSLEMAKEQLGIRMLCSEARVDAQKIRSGYGGRLGTEHWKQLIHAAGKLSDAPIFIDDTNSLTILEMRAKARRLKSEHNLSLLIVDYLQLVAGEPGGGKENRQQEISDISRSLKGLAKELSIPIVALSQLSRAVEARPEKKKRPILADLRESGAIEQDADLVLFIYREEVYDPCKCPREGECICGKRKGTAEIIIGKQRNGPIGDVLMAFIDAYTRFEDLADDHPARYNQEGFV
ncbi:MAG: replicative DNA helicase [Nitrospirae bacterium]|nr:replicative DNA helicase [Candidatus Troglogloeales bacterium]